VAPQASIDEQLGTTNPAAGLFGPKHSRSGLVIYGLTYTALDIGFGFDYPRLPMFAVPRPTTLVTAALLLIASGAPRFNVVPILWAAAGRQFRRADL
jgi:hypothetical protein